MTSFGAYLNGIGVAWPEFRKEWIAAEDSGFEIGWTMDNVVGPIHGHMEIPVYEAYTLLTAAAEATSTLRLGTMITPCNRRHPALLAKMAATIDQISNGRLIVGMGPGDHEQYFLPWGMSYDPPRERIARLREELDVMRLLWTRQSSDYDGKYYQLQGAVVEPKPIQDGGPPICIGLNFGKQLMPKVAATYANQVNVYIAGADAAREMVELVKSECESIGRDPAEIEFSRVVQVHLGEEPLEDIQEREIAELVALGVSRDEVELSDRTYDLHAVGGHERIAETLIKEIDDGFEHLVLMIGEAVGQSRVDAITEVGTQILPIVRAALVLRV